MFIEVNGISYHVHVVGEGEPLLLLHGFTGSNQTWTPFIETWSPFFQLILVDLIGHGKTDHPQDFNRYQIEKVALDIKEILVKLRLSKAHVLGYSMGGRVALTFALIYLDFVQTLLLESSSPGLKLQEERVSRKQSDDLLAKKIEEEGLEAFIAYWEKIPLFSTQESRVPVEQKAKIQNERLQNSCVGLANSLRGMGTGVQPSWWEQLMTIRKPVLLLTGEHDQKFCQINKEMRQCLADAKLVIVEDCGHAIHVEQPEFFGKIVKDYLMDQANIK